MYVEYCTLQKMFLLLEIYHFHTTLKQVILFSKYILELDWGLLKEPKSIWHSWTAEPRHQFDLQN